MVAPFNSEHKMPTQMRQLQADEDPRDGPMQQVFGAFASPMIGKNLFQTDEKAKKENHSSLISSKDIYDKSIEINKLTGSKR